jgi:hypothetical protein
LTRNADYRKLTRNRVDPGCLNSMRITTRVLTILTRIVGIVLTRTIEIVLTRSILTVLTRDVETVVTRIAEIVLTRIVKIVLTRTPSRRANYRKLIRIRGNIGCLNSTMNSTRFVKKTTTTRVKARRRRTEVRLWVRVYAPQKKKDDDKATRNMTTEDSGSHEMPAGSKRWRHASRHQHRSEKGENVMGGLIFRVSWLQFASAKTFLTSADIPSTTLHGSKVRPKAKNVAVSDGDSNWFTQLKSLA